jgi:Leucine-rich repeat (LRR) protein
MSDNEQVDEPQIDNPDVQGDEPPQDEGNEPKPEDEPPKQDEPNQDKPEDGEPKPEGENPDGEKKEGEEGEEGEKKVIEPPEPEVELPTLNKAEDKKRTMRIIKKGLTKIQKTNDNNGYAFTDMNVSGQEILNLYDILSLYPHVRYANFSKNKIDDISTVDMMPYLLTLNASENLIDNVKVFTYQKLFYVTELDLSSNKISRLPGIVLPCLRKLVLDNNVIDNCDEFRGHPKLEVLSLKKNKLKSCKGIRNSPNLQSVDVSENEITHIYDILNVPALKKLNLTKNKIAGLEKALPALPSLEELNLTENLMTDSTHLRKLSEIPSLKTFICTGNPMNEEIGDGLKKLLIKLFMPKAKPSDVTVEPRKVPPMIPPLVKVNEDDVIPEEDLAPAWDELVEEEKKRIEEEEARKAEEEEKKRQEEEERKRKEEEEAAAKEAEAEAEKERLREQAQREAADKKEVDTEDQE